ncbi:hypothetical protein CYLTODRAFT_123927 [Cylindrobasidium torrendii FP15055 ss-10]|uniref:Uncharacterized protein n=1 Tax=Cylindrobasidium torrendii FP15055 ss-10 TaxID=1314674 RepID=A0A0D7BMT1_9AGAR|nr:hypothetical protein CYLTODRAFT_123927 [Cylindrobasidium torrendii FP15055 ss-10]
MRPRDALQLTTFSPSMMDFSFDSEPSSSVPTKRSALDVDHFSEEGFHEFELDLSSFSRSPSPTSPTTGDSHTVAPSSSSPTSSMRLSPDAASALRGTWGPVFHYVGRGTPVDHSRRSQWGGSTGQRSRTSSIETGSLRSFTHSPGRSKSMFALPEESKLRFDVQPTEWDSMVRTVLHPSGDGGVTAEDAKLDAAEKNAEEGENVREGDPSALLSAELGLNPPANAYASLPSSPRQESSALPDEREDSTPDRQKKRWTRASMADMRPFKKESRSWWRKVLPLGKKHA